MLVGTSQRGQKKKRRGWENVITHTSSSNLREPRPPWCELRCVVRGGFRKKVWQASTYWKIPSLLSAFFITTSGELLFATAAVLQDMSIDPLEIPEKAYLDRATRRVGASGADERAEALGVTLYWRGGMLCVEKG